MPLYEITDPGQLVPFRRIPGGPELYEKDIEDLVWTNPDEFLGEALFLVQRQPLLPGGGRPDVVGLDKRARVVVIEVKRDVDRYQLAQILEYAGWARGASLDTLSALYHGGREAFFGDWQEFMETPVPAPIDPKPQLVLIARDFHGRTRSALEFLLDSDLPIRFIPVSIYEDEQKRRFLDIEAEHEPEFARAVDVPPNVDHTMVDGHRVRLSDLLDAGLLRAGQRLEWNRPKLGRRFQAEVTTNGSIELSDGRRFASPSRAGMEAAGVPSLDGWYAWRLDPEGTLLNELRVQLVAGRPGSTDEGTASGTATAAVGGGNEVATGQAETAGDAFLAGNAE